MGSRSICRERKRRAHSPTSTSTHNLIAEAKGCLQKESRKKKHLHPVKSISSTHPFQTSPFPPLVRSLNMADAPQTTTPDSSNSNSNDKVVESNNFNALRRDVFDLWGYLKDPETQIKIQCGICYDRDLAVVGDPAAGKDGQQENSDDTHERYVVLPACGHAFGARCIGEWLWSVVLENNPPEGPSCPSCRKPAFCLEHHVQYFPTYDGRVRPYNMDMWYMLDSLINECALCTVGLLDENCEPPTRASRLSDPHAIVIPAALPDSPAAAERRRQHWRSQRPVIREQWAREMGQRITDLRMHNAGFLERRQAALDGADEIEAIAAAADVGDGPLGRLEQFRPALARVVTNVLMDQEIEPFLVQFARERIAEAAGEIAEWMADLDLAD